MNNPTMLTYIQQEQTGLSHVLATYPKQFETLLADAPITTNHWLKLVFKSTICFEKKLMFSSSEMLYSSDLFFIIH